MPQNRIKQHPHPDLLSLPHQHLQLRLGPPLGAHAALLLKLAQVVQVVDVVAVGVRAGGLAGGGDPDAGDAEGREGGEEGGEEGPVGGAGGGGRGEVPFEGLEEGGV